MAAPTTPILDNYNRANSGSIGAAYTPILSTAEPLPILNANAAAIPVTSTCSAFWNATTFTDCEIYGDFNSGSEWDLWIRMSGFAASLLPTHGYVLNSNAAGSLALLKSDGTGNVTQIGSTLTGLSFTSMWLGAIGTNIFGYTFLTGTWTQRFNVTDATHTGPGNIGFEIGGSGVTFDNLGGGSLPVGATHFLGLDGVGT